MVPAIEFQPLGSGSKGNAILVRGPGGVILVDAGLPLQELLERLQGAKQMPHDIKAILLTHRHLDHVRAARPLSRRFRIPIYATETCLRHQRRKTLSSYQLIHPGVPFQVAGLRICPVRLVHDAPETLAFRIEAGGRRVGIATDLGSSGGGLQQAFRGLDLLYLEFNHDIEMLRGGIYPYPLKQRISSSKGHLSNDQAAALLKRLATPRLRHLYLAHLSENNNRPELARAAASNALREVALPHVDILIARQHRISESVRLSGLVNT